ncbi:thiol peroxidase [Cellulophaga sp. HaHa_2_95]|uniref:thiol peroxidase n=1 Tax=unclassified Cellulophaga TaxID=2634405 RepID=UPI001C4F0A50|nr:thiol peroxidase [Cellulophaga sp. HaHa_2_95]QXP54838.1 thiol peroxidase [Cellulophaga sp. HaHa_2_95]
MAVVTLKGNKLNTIGSLPAVGTSAPSFTLTKNDLSAADLSQYKGKKVVLNIFPSVDTGTCAQSVRQFNTEASELKDTVVLCISKDLPFAQARFCGAEGLSNVEMLSDFKDGNFGTNYGLSFADGPLAPLLSRSVVVLNEEGNVIYTEQVAETVDEPNYKAALEAIVNA